MTINTTTSSSFFPGSERPRSLELADRVRDVDPFPGAEVRDRRREVRIGKRVRRVRRERRQAARELVQPLRTAFERRDPALEAELDRLVVAGFEVQSRHVVERSPVATPQRVLVE